MGASSGKQYVRRSEEVLEIITDYADVSDHRGESLSDAPIKKVSEPLLWATCDGNKDDKLKQQYETRKPILTKPEVIDLWIGENRYFKRDLPDIDEEMEFCKLRLKESNRTSILSKRKSRYSEANIRMSFLVNTDDDRLPENVGRRQSSVVFRFDTDDDTSNSSDIDDDEDTDRTPEKEPSDEGVARRASSPAALCLKDDPDPAREFEEPKLSDYLLRRASAPPRATSGSKSRRPSVATEGSRRSQGSSRKGSLSSSGSGSDSTAGKSGSSQDGTPHESSASDSGKSLESIEEVDSEEEESDEGDRSSEETSTEGEDEESDEENSDEMSDKEAEGMRRRSSSKRSSSLKFSPFNIEYRPSMTAISSSLADRDELEGSKKEGEGDGEGKGRGGDGEGGGKKQEVETDEGTSTTMDSLKFPSFTIDDFKLFEENNEFSHCSTCDHWYFMPERNQEDLMRLQRRHSLCSKLNGHHEHEASKKRCRKCKQSGKYAYSIPDYVTREKGWSRCPCCQRWVFTPTGEETLAVTHLKIDRTKYPFAFSFFAYYYPADVDDALMPFRRHVLARAVKTMKSKMHKDIFEQHFGDAFVDRRVLSIERKTRTRIALCKMGTKFVKGLPRRRIIIFSQRIEAINHALNCMEELMPDVMATALFHRPIPANNSRSWNSPHGLCVRRHKHVQSNSRPPANVLRKSWESKVLPHRIVPPLLSEEKNPFRIFSTHKPINTSGSNVARKSKVRFDMSKEGEKVRPGTKKPKPERKTSSILWKYSHPHEDKPSSRSKEEEETCLSFVSIEDRKSFDSRAIPQREPCLSQPASLTQEKRIKFPVSYVTNILFRQNGKGKATSLCLKDILKRFDCSIEKIEVHKETCDKSHYIVVFKYELFDNLLAVCEELGYTQRS